MARGPDKSFDRTEVLDRVMVEFWKHGYAATSISTLREVTGLGAKSLYDTFGGKRELFLASLERYNEVVLPKMFDDKISRHPPEIALRKVLEGLVMQSPKGPARGCLLGVAAAEIEDDAELSTAVRRYLNNIQEALSRVIAKMPLKETSPSPEELANMLVSLLQGIHLISRVDGNSRETKVAIKTALDLVEANRA